MHTHTCLLFAHRWQMLRLNVPNEKLFSLLLIAPSPPFLPLFISLSGSVIPFTPWLWHSNLPNGFYFLPNLANVFVSVELEFRVNLGGEIVGPCTIMSVLSRISPQNCINRFYLWNISHGLIITMLMLQVNYDLVNADGYCYNLFFPNDPHCVII